MRNFGRSTVRQLTELGYRVLEAEHAAAALAILSGQRVDLLFTDVVMPGSMDGLDLAHHALALRPDLKILLDLGLPGCAGRRPADARIAAFPMLRQAVAPGRTGPDGARGAGCRRRPATEPLQRGFASGGLARLYRRSMPASEGKRR